MLPMRQLQVSVVCVLVGSWYQFEFVLTRAVLVGPYSLCFVVCGMIFCDWKGAGHSLTLAILRMWVVMFFLHLFEICIYFRFVFLINRYWTVEFGVVEYIGMFVVWRVLMWLVYDVTFLYLHLSFNCFGCCDTVNNHHGYQVE